MSYIGRPATSGSALTWSGSGFVFDTAIAGGGGGSAPERPPIDANHTHVWHMGAGCTTTGQNILSDFGGVTLNRDFGSGSIQTGYSLFKSQQSAYATQNTLGNPPSDNGWTSFAGSIPAIATGSALTIEAIALFPPESIGSVADYSGIVGLFNISVLNYAQITWKSSGIQPGFISQNPAFYNTQGTFGAGFGQVVPGMPTHLMFTWDPTIPRQQFYINGRLLTTNTDPTAGPRGQILDIISVKFIAGGSIADIRISNISRPQSYAIAATRAMRAL